MKHNQEKMTDKKQGGVRKCFFLEKKSSRVKYFDSLSGQHDSGRGSGGLVRNNQNQTHAQN
jgi:hypothetical protein